MKTLKLLFQIWRLILEAIILSISNFIMSESGKVTPIWVINLLFEYSWYVFMLLLSIAVIVVIAYVLTNKAHIGPTRMVSTPLDSLPHTSDSCDLIQNPTPNSSFACLHSYRCFIPRHNANRVTTHLTV